MAQSVETVTEEVPTHPLNTPWSVYYSSLVNKSAQERYQENLKLVARIATLEEYAELYARVKRPSALEIDQGIFIARGDLIPSWEALPEGGCWCYRSRFSWRRNPRPHPTHINRVWEQASLAVIGEQLREPTVVCISYLAKEDCDVIRVWASDVSSTESCRRISAKLTQLFNLRSDTLEFKRNKTAIQANLKKDSHPGGGRAPGSGATPAVAPAAAPVESQAPDGVPPAASEAQTRDAPRAVGEQSSPAHEQEKDQ